MKTYNNILRQFKLLTAIAVIAVAIFLLTPRFYEPGGEAWKQWASARILKETGGFPVFSLGPGYVLYLGIFQHLDYPVSVFLEYFITHIFVYMALFLMLESFIPFALALTLVCAWIPHIATLEPGGLVAGIGFIALYIRLGKDSGFNRGYLPPLLLAAALCHSAYLLFLAGNIIGVVVERHLKGHPIIDLSQTLKGMRIIPAAFRVLLITVALASIFFQSHRPDNNQMLASPKYVPVSLDNPVSVTFFHIGNWKYAMRTAPANLQIYQDWYLTNERAFGGAKTILEALIRRPAVVFANIADNAVYMLRLPMRFLTGNFQGTLPKAESVLFIAISWILLPIGVVGAARRLKENGFLPVIYSIALGTIAMAGVFLLTWCTARYAMALLPIALLVIVNVGYGAMKFSKLTYGIIIASSVLVILTFAYPLGRSAQIEAILHNRGILSGAKPVSMVDAHHALLKSLDNNPDVLALEDVWIKGFSKVNLDKVHNVFGLPPHTDPSGDTERELGKLQVIWVSCEWSKPAPSIATQAFLRYKLHVAPFLEKALRNGWAVEDIKGYGKVYEKYNHRHN